MARPYMTEMSRLFETFGWASSCDISALRQAVKTAGLYSLMAIGSGGSLTAAHALVSLHRRWTGHLAAVATPLEAIFEPVSAATSLWLISAGGANVDILSAFHALVAREPRQICVLCGNEASPLSDAARRYPYTDLIIHPPPTGKDGFLATNSLLAFATIMARAYVAEFGGGDSTFETEMADVRTLLGNSRHWDEWKARLQPLWRYPTTLVLHGPQTRVGAVDLESKFTEAALGNLQVADYRNFAHGRHHWLAKRAQESAVIAFVSSADEELARRTLDLIPSDVPQVRLTLPGSADCVMLTSLLAALRITGWAGEARHLDPGRPGVPDFGRKLYRLALPKMPGRTMATSLDDEDVVAIERKAGLSFERLEQQGTLARWVECLSVFRRKLTSARFAGVVLDYDGTLVDTRNRFSAPTGEIASQLCRLASSGVWVGVATGRGVSVRRDLRRCMPPELWKRVLVGYYNGAEIGLLADDHVPLGGQAPCEELSAAARALRDQPELAEIAVQTDRRFQITLEARRPTSESRLWDLAQQTLLMTGSRDLTVTRSSHSVDVMAPNVSKLNLYRRLQAGHEQRSLLAIGDRGRWPGNDYELLRTPFALSVDELSANPDTCWNLAPRGQRGVAATLIYLRAMVVEADLLRYEPAAAK